LPTRKRHGKKPIMDYSNSHVVTSNQYLVVSKQKALEKKIVDKIKKEKSRKVNFEGRHGIDKKV
jgi:hypothetical protein